MMDFLRRVAFVESFLLPALYFESCAISVGSETKLVNAREALLTSS
jgi:hypothetical protein